MEMMGMTHNEYLIVVVTSAVVSAVVNLLMRMII